MKRLYKIALWALWVLLSSTLAVAQQPPQPKPDATDKPPVISPDVLKRFWQADDAQQRAQRDLQIAQAQSQAAAQGWQAAVKALNDACGEKFQIKQDVAGQDPYCAVKPEAPKPADAPKK